MKLVKVGVYFIILLILFISLYGAIILFVINFFNEHLDYPPAFFFISGFSLFLVFLLSIKQLTILNKPKKYLILLIPSILFCSLNYFTNILFKKGFISIIIPSLPFKNIFGGIVFGIFTIFLCIWLFIQVFIKKNLID